MMLTLPVKQRSSEVIEIPRWVNSKTIGSNPLRNSSRFKELREISKKRKNEDEQDSNTRSASLNETIKVWGRLVDDSNLQRQRDPTHSTRLLTQRSKRLLRAGTSRASNCSLNRRTLQPRPPPTSRASHWSSLLCRLQRLSNQNSRTSSLRCPSRKRPCRDIVTQMKPESQTTFLGRSRITGPSTTCRLLEEAAPGSGSRSWYSTRAPVPKRERVCRCSRFEETTSR